MSVKAIRDFDATLAAEHSLSLTAETIIRLFIQGNSIRRVERITGMHRDSILRLLVLAGERGETMLAKRVNGVPVRDVQCDEMCGFVGCKEKNVQKKHPVGFGDAYCLVGIERHTKLVLAWHPGRRSSPDTYAFVEKLDVATSGLQITTDGFAAYPEAIHLNLGTPVSFAQLIKVYASPRDGEQRYSPQKSLMPSQYPGGEGQIPSESARFT